MDRTFRRRWVTAFVAGELVGFVPPAVTGAFLASRGAGDAVMIVGLTLAGALEGAAIGGATAMVLRRWLARLPTGWWVLATSVGAALAWCFGMSLPALIAAGPPHPVTLVLIVLVAPVAVSAMGLGQWLLLRRIRARTLRWVPISAGAWLLGVAIPVVALSTVPDGTPLPIHVAIGVIAAVAMGAVVGLITGRTMWHLIAPEPVPLSAQHPV